MKRIVDIFTNEWSPEIVWTYIVNLEGNENSEQMNHDPLDPRVFEDEGLRLAVRDGRGDLANLIAKVRE